MVNTKSHLVVKLADLPGATVYGETYLKDGAPSLLTEEQAMLDKLVRGATPARLGTPMPAMGSAGPIPKSPLGLTYAHLREVEELEKQFNAEAKNSILAAFMPDVAMSAADDALDGAAEVGDVELDDVGHADPMEAEIPVSPAASPLRLKEEMPASEDGHVQIFNLTEQRWGESDFENRRVCTSCSVDVSYAMRYHAAVCHELSHFCPKLTPDLRLTPFPLHPHQMGKVYDNMKAFK
eukprot:1656656-Amphidinium_carterae.2